MVPSKPTKKTRQGLAAKALQTSTRAAKAQPARAPSARPKRSGTACKKGPNKSRTLRLAGCLTVPSKPTKKTRQGLAARALQQAQEQLRHGQGAAKAPSARPKRSGTAWKKGPKKSRKLRLGGCLTVPSKPSKKTRQGLAAKALQQAQEQLRHGQGAAAPSDRKGTEKEPKIEAWRVPNGTFETH